MSSPAANNDGMGSLLYGNGTCRFRVWAPFAQRVQVMGKFTGWTTGPIDLAREGASNWSVDVPGVGALDMYKYRIHTQRGPGNDDSQIWERADARALQVEHSGDGAASYVIDQGQFRAPERPYSYQTPAFENFIIYELHVPTFTGRNDFPFPTGALSVGTFGALESKLRYISDLEFSAIALMPVGENPGDTSEGYSPSHQYAPESAFATSKEKAVEELRRLIDAAHRAGLAVVFDVVYNHASFVDNRYWRYDGNCDGPPDGGIYFKNGHHTQFGDGYAVWEQEVKDFFLDNGRLLLREYNVDGLRFDAAHLIQPDAVKFIVGELRREFPSKYLIAEYNPGDSNSAAAPVDPYTELCFHATWDMSGTSQAYAALSDDNAVDKLLTLIGDFSAPNSWYSIRYPTGSHDDVNRDSSSDLGKGYIVERFGGRENGWARAKARLAWSLAVALPGTPMMFMGTEGHLDGYWDWRREAARGDHRPDWNLIGDPTGAPMQRLVTHANLARWNHPALRSPAGNVTHVDRVGRVVAFKRYTNDGDVVLVVVNISNNQWAFHDYAVNLGGETGTWLEFFNSQAPEYGGFDSTGNFSEYLTVANGVLFINLPRWSLLMFKKV